MNTTEFAPKPSSISPIPNTWRPPPPAMAGSDPELDIAELFCHYNALYFRDSLGACAVSWAEEPLPYGDVSSCDYYPGGGGCIILLSKSLYKCRTDSNLKNVLLHEMIHAYMCIKDNNNNHGDHGANFQKLMNTINFNSVADPHRPVGGYSITMLHEIGKKYYRYKCESCGDLVKSIKIGGPSHDDCTERMGANYSCQNSMCHWHRHKKRCSGRYYRVRESSPGRVELKGSKASAEEPLDEGKVEKAVCGSWHAKHTSNKCGTSNKHELEDASAEFLDPTDDAIGNSGLDSSRERSNKKIKLSKDTGFDLLTGTTVQEAPQPLRTDALKKNQECSRQKKRKISKRDGSYSVIIEWLNYYCVDEPEEDEVPLINKRTERRKQQKLLKNSQASEASIGVRGASSTSHVINGNEDSCFGSCSQGPGDSNRSENVPVSRVEERLLPNHPVSSHGVAGDQAGHETVTYPLDSPIIGEIVDISDG